MFGNIQRRKLKSNRKFKVQGTELWDLLQEEQPIRKLFTWLLKLLIRNVLTPLLKLLTISLLACLLKLLIRNTYSHVSWRYSSGASSHIIATSSPDQRPSPVLSVPPAVPEAFRDNTFGCSQSRTTCPPVPWTSERSARRLGLSRCGHAVLRQVAVCSCVEARWTHTHGTYRQWPEHEAAHGAEDEAKSSPRCARTRDQGFRGSWRHWRRAVRSDSCHTWRGEGDRGCATRLSETVDARALLGDRCCYWRARIQQRWRHLNAWWVKPLLSGHFKRLVKAKGLGSSIRRAAEDQR